MIHAQRLRECAQHAGGIGKFAQLVGISRAQLTRYLAGAPVPSDTLKVMATQANVSSGWLLGEASTGQQGLRDYLNLTREITEQLHLQLQRTTLPRAFTATEVARIVELMVFSQSYSNEQIGKIIPYREIDIYHGLHYVSHLCQNDWLQIYVEGCKMYEHFEEQEPRNEWFAKFSTIVNWGFASFYSNEPMGTDYFERLNLTPVLPVGSAHAKMMEDWLSILRQTFGVQRSLRLLDMGCGNGRHLVYLAPRGLFHLKGLDSSPLGLKICREHEASGALPKGCVEQQDLFSYNPEGNYDAVMLITMGQYLPMIPGHQDHGFAKLISIALAALKPGGLLLMLFREEGVNEFFPWFNVCHSHNKINKLLGNRNIKILKKQQIELVQPKTMWIGFGRHIRHQHYWVIQKC